MVRQVAEDLAGKAAVVQVNTDESPRLSRQFNITGVPALILIRNGTVVDRLGGARAGEEIVAWVRRQGA